MLCLLFIVDHSSVYDFGIRNDGGSCDDDDDIDYGRGRNAVRSDCA